MDLVLREPQHERKIFKTISIPPPFALRFSKGEQGVFQQATRLIDPRLAVSCRRSESVFQKLSHPLDDVRRLVDDFPCQALHFFGGNGIKIVLSLSYLADKIRVL